MKKIKLGFCGAGTVGGGALEILKTKRASFLAQGLDFEVTMICARNLEALQSYADEGIALTKEYKEVISSDQVDIVIEVIGGTTIAWDLVKEALENGKSVVTANKALIAEHFDDLYKILKENPSLKFGFEAAVGGGIPIISTLQTQFQSDEVLQLAGILNGTTNFILSKMETEGASYNVALKEAQDLGFAEADPSADVKGDDARAKISILTQLVSGVKIAESNMFMQGIERVSAIDFEYAHFLKSTIKLLAVSRIDKHSVSGFVTPTLVFEENTIAGVHGAKNILEVQSKFQENTYLIGQGAGKFPTGNSIVTDLLRITQNELLPHFSEKQTRGGKTDFTSCFYIRFWVKDQQGIIRKIGEYCEANNISIDSVVQLPIQDSENVPFVITTDETTLTSIQNFCDQIQTIDFCNEAPFFMPILR